MTGTTRNELALLATPFVVTVTSANPAGKLLGTGTSIRVSLQELGVAAVPLKVTDPGELPNPEPIIVTGEPTGLTGPTLGDKLLIVGAAWLNAMLWIVNNRY